MPPPPPGGSGSGDGDEAGDTDGSDDGGAPATPVMFVDVTTQAGVGYTQHSPTDVDGCVFNGPLDPIPETCQADRMTGGVAVGDYDNDGDPDIYVTTLDGRDRLFSNSGDGTFEDVAQEVGLDEEVATNGAAWFDSDNDGDLDLYVTTVGEVRHRLHVNQGDGTFAERGQHRGATLFNPFLHGGTSIAVGDYDRDGWLDLYVAEWRPRMAAGSGGGAGSGGSAPSNSRLLRNRGPGRPGYFEDASEQAGVALVDEEAPWFPHQGVYTLAPAFADLDGDGWQDLAVAADFGTSRLYWNDGDGTFTEGTATAGVGVDRFGMGSTFGDIDGDGLLDWFVTSISDVASCDDPSCSGWGPGNRLYRNRGDRTFEDVTDEADVAQGFWGWGAAMLDHDNDGDLDIAMTNGFDLPDGIIAPHYASDPMRLWLNDGGFPLREAAKETGLDDLRAGKGLAVLDYDMDGDLDLFVVHNGDGPALFRNDGGSERSYLRVRALTGEDECDALGAVVTLRDTDGTAQIREIGASTHLLGWSESVAHFGLGDDTRPVSVSVRWPDGSEQAVAGVDPGQTLELSP